MDHQSLSNAIKNTITLIKKHGFFHKRVEEVTRNLFKEIIDFEKEHNVKLRYDYKTTAEVFAIFDDYIKNDQSPTTYETIIEFLEQGRKALKVQGGWKSALLLPAKKGVYLAYCEDTIRPKYGFYAALEFDGVWENSDILVTHWRELPPPPVEALPPIYG